MPNDITDLTGDALWDALVDTIDKGQKLVVRKPKKHPKILTCTPIKDDWTKTAVILVVQKTVCSCCGSCYEHPTSHILILSMSPSQGIHAKTIGKADTLELELSGELPFKLETRFVTVEHCQSCFDMVDLFVAKEAYVTKGSRDACGDTLITEDELDDLIETLEEQGDL